MSDDRGHLRAMRLLPFAAAVQPVDLLLDVFLYLSAMQLLRGDLALKSRLSATSGPQSTVSRERVPSEPSQDLDS